MLRADVQVKVLIYAGEQANPQHTVSLDQAQLARETELLARMCVCGACMHSPSHTNLCAF